MFQCPLIISGFRVGTKICIIRVELATISREPGPQHPRPGSGEDTAALLRTIADIAHCVVQYVVVGHWAALPVTMLCAVYVITMNPPKSQQKI